MTTKIALGLSALIIFGLPSLSQGLCTRGEMEYDSGGVVNCSTSWLLDGVQKTGTITVEITTDDDDNIISVDSGVLDGCFYTCETTGVTECKYLTYTCSDDGSWTTDGVSHTYSS